MSLTSSTPTQIDQYQCEGRILVVVLAELMPVAFSQVPLCPRQGILGAVLSNSTSMEDSGHNQRGRGRAKVAGKARPQQPPQQAGSRQQRPAKPPHGPPKQQPLPQPGSTDAHPPPTLQSLTLTATTPSITTVRFSDSIFQEAFSPTLSLYLYHSCHMDVS